MVRWYLGNPAEDMRNNCRSQRIPQENSENQLRAYKGSQRLNRQPTTYLSTPHICYSCVACLFVGLLTVEAEAVSGSFVGFWNPVPHTGFALPALIHGELISLTSTWYATFYWYSRETCSFLNRKLREGRSRLVVGVPEGELKGEVLRREKGRGERGNWG